MFAIAEIDTCHFKLNFAFCGSFGGVVYSWKMKML